jgi:tight adherence protein B
MALLLMAVGVFIVGAVLVFGAYLLLAGMPKWLVQRKIDQRIADVTTPLTQEPTETASLVKGQFSGALPALDKVGEGTAAHSWLVRLIEQSGAKTGVSTIMLSGLALGVLVAFAVTLLVKQPWGLVPGFLLGASIPIVVLLRKRTVRIKRFEEFFPEALDMLARAIKAGHAFTTAMGMVADEGQDPIGPEFR